MISGRQGAADIRFMNNTAILDRDLRAGRYEQMHANNEWADLEDYINSIKILAQTLMQWCGASE